MNFRHSPSPVARIRAGLARPLDKARRYGLAIAGAGLALCALGSAQVHAQDAYPSRPVKLVAPYTAGGSADAIARILATGMADKLGQAVVVENRAGAAGVLGTSSVARAAPDGYTLLLGIVGPFSISPVVTPGAAKYDPVKDFSPVSLVIRMPSMLVVSASSPLKSIDDLLKLGKASQNYNFPSSGVGSYGHLAGEMFNLAANTSFVHIPYKGTSEQIPDLISGRVHMGFFGTGDVMRYINAGQLRALAVFSDTRWPAAPNVPTNIEANFRHSLPEVWFGIVAPAGTPPHIVNRLNEVTRQVLADPAVKERFDKMGFLPSPSTPAEFADYIRKDNERYKAVVKAAKIATE